MPSPSRETESPEAQKGRHTRSIVRFAAIVLAALVLALGFVVAATWHDSSLEVHQQQGGNLEFATDADADIADERAKFTRSTPKVDPPAATALIGSTPEQAVERIGHAAAVRSRTDIKQGNATETLLDVPLADVRGKDGPGYPAVQLWVDERGIVVEARYSASLRTFGFSNGLTFEEAIGSAHVVELALGDIGVAVQPGAVRLSQDESTYASYRDDGMTLEREFAEFQGKGSSADGEVRWVASLEYDYADAIQSGNLVDTHRVLVVGVDGRGK